MNRQSVLCVLYNMYGEKKSETGVKRAKWHAVRTEYVLRCHNLRNQRTSLRNRLDEQAALHLAALEEKDSELANMRELLDTRAQDMTSLETSSREMGETPAPL